MSIYINDKPEYINDSLNSIFKQTLIPDEIIIVLDGPILKQTESALNNFLKKSKIIKVVKLEKNMGHGDARRIGLENCTNKYVALMDCDDICIEDRFEKQINCFKNHKNLSVVGGTILEFENSVENVVAMKVMPTSNSKIYSFAKSRCPFNQMTVMFNKKDVMDSGGYLDWYCNEDYFLWIRMMQKKYIFCNISDPLVYVRVNDNYFNRRGGLKYFFSEVRLQYHMFKINLINIFKLILNISIRFFIQILMPNTIRKFIFLKLIRKNYDR
tara:strand:- start:1348 stop:2157 length:810 start_codon:yes stop_codon:yes gene_type:complete